MALAYQFEPKEGYLLVRTLGVSENVGELLQFAADVASAVARCGADRVLLDDSKATIKLKFHEILLNAKPFFNVCSQRPLVKRTAIVCRSHSFCLYSYLIEIATKMVSSKLKLFTDSQAAEEWLFSKETH